MGLIQRVSHADVVVDGETTGKTGKGILLLLSVQKHDTEASAGRLIHKLLNYRIFPDAEGKMNLSVKEVSGGVLVVSQFTLAADTRKGLRPSFSSAAPPADAERLYNYFVEQMRQQHNDVSTGVFGGDMKVSLCNDGPVTFLLEV